LELGIELIAEWLFQQETLVKLCCVDLIATLEIVLLLFLPPLDRAINASKVIRMANA
jgi:hypothetical protein